MKHVFEGNQGKVVEDVVDLTDDPKVWNEECTCDQCNWKGPMSKAIISEVKIVDGEAIGSVVCPVCKK